MRYQVGDRVILNNSQYSDGRQNKVDRWRESNVIILIDIVKETSYEISIDGRDDDFWWDDTMIDHEKTLKFNKKEIKTMQVDKPNFDKTKQTLKNMGVSKVVFNKPAVVVYLNDGRKGIAKCGEMDTFDEEVGFALAYTIAKSSDKVVNKSNYKRHIDNLSHRKAKKKKDCVVFEVK